MSKFKAGDRVRLTKGNMGWGEKGDTGAIIHVGYGSCFLHFDRMIDGDDKWYVPETSLELVEQPKFKIGDKVRQSKACNVNLSDHWASYWAKSGDAKVTEFFVTRVVGNSISYSATDGGHGPLVDASDLELVAAPLKIEAGKFYKRRDGAKAGPAVPYNDPVVAFTLGGPKPLENRFYDTSGKHGAERIRNVRDYDLVSEWVADEPAALKIETGKFYKTRDGRKVGPMEEKRGDCRYPFVCRVTPTKECSVQMAIWERDGTNFSERCLDLIAEWTSSCAAAQVDNLRDEYGPVVKAGAKAEVVAAGNDNGKPKFKVGDRVEITGNLPGSISKIGSFGHVDGRALGSGRFSVRLDEGNSYFFDAKEVAHAELVTAAPATTTPAIVCLIENGQPKPSTEPHVHANKEAAGKEATRLARKFPGQEFGVYELVSTIQEAKPTYKHEWQRLAAGGRKIEAIKELRGMTGLGLRATKDAVEYWIANDEPRSRLAA